MTQDLIMPLSVIEFIGKEEIKQLATNNVNELLIRGEQSPLKQYVLFKKIAEYVSVAIDKLKDSAQVEGARFNKQYSYGAKVELRYTGDKLDYSSDLIYQELEIKLKQRKELLNMAYKSIGAVIFDADEGKGFPLKKIGKKLPANICPVGKRKAAFRNLGSF